MIQRYAVVSLGMKKRAIEVLYDLLADEEHREDARESSALLRQLKKEGRNTVTMHEALILDGPNLFSARGRSRIMRDWDGRRVEIEAGGRFYKIKN